MKKKKISRLERIAHQLDLIDKINNMLNMCKEDKDGLGIRQYEHLKKQYIKNLYEMLEENYQIPIPTMEKKAA